MCCSCLAMCLPHYRDLLSFHYGAAKGTYSTEALNERGGASESLCNSYGRMSSRLGHHITEHSLSGFSALDFPLGGTLLSLLLLFSHLLSFRKTGWIRSDSECDDGTSRTATFGSATAHNWVELLCSCPPLKPKFDSGIVRMLPGWLPRRP